MKSVENLIAKNLDIWTSSIKIKTSSGKGSNKNIELYGIKKLRQLIFNLAVRGMLAPQDPKEEAAVELLRRISQEKERVAKKNKNRKNNHLHPITKTNEPYTLPSNWEWCRIEQIGIGSTGKTPKTNIRSNFGGKIQFIGPGEITQTGEILESQKTLSNEGLNQSTEAFPGSILMVCIGGSIGKSAIVHKHIAFNQQINCLHPIYIKSEYLNAVFSSDRFQMDLIENATGSATPIINRSKWEGLLVPIPPLAEQDRIVAKINQLISLCDQMEKEQESNIKTNELLVESLLNSLTCSSEDSSELVEAWEIIQENFDILFITESSIEQLKKAILQLAVKGLLVKQKPSDESASALLKKIASEKARLIRDKKIKKVKPLPLITKDEEPFSLPSGWGWEKMGNLAIQITDGTHHTPNYVDKGVAFISVKDIDGEHVSFKNCRYITEEQHKEINIRCNPQFGDLLICRIGTLGRVTIVDTERPFSLFVSVGLIKFFQQYYTPRFAHIVFNSPLLLNQFEKIKVGGSHTNKLNLRDLPSLILPIAPLSEQCRIIDKVDELIALCDQLKETITSIRATKTNLADNLLKKDFI